MRIHWLGVSLALLIVGRSVASGADEAKNLVPNGDFEKKAVDRDGPDGWGELLDGYHWVRIDEKRGSAMRFEIPRRIARGVGFEFYSDKFPIEEGQTYRASLEMRTDGPGAVIFINGYADLKGKERRVYRKQIKSDKRIEPRKGWRTLTFEFTPTQPMAVSKKVLEHRGMVLAALKKAEVEFFIHGGDAGVVQFDNVSIVKADKKSKDKTESPGDPKDASIDGEGDSGQ